MRIVPFDSSRTLNAHSQGESPLNPFVMRCQWSEVLAGLTHMVSVPISCGRSNIPRSTYAVALAGNLTPFPKTPGAEVVPMLGAAGNVPVLSAYGLESSSNVHQKIGDNASGVGVSVIVGLGVAVPTVVGVSVLVGGGTEVGSAVAVSVIVGDETKVGSGVAAAVAVAPVTSVGTAVSSRAPVSVGAGVSVTATVADCVTVGRGIGVSVGATVSVAAGVPGTPVMGAGVSEGCTTVGGSVGLLTGVRVDSDGGIGAVQTREMRQITMIPTTNRNVDSRAILSLLQTVCATAPHAARSHLRPNSLIEPDLDSSYCLAGYVFARRILGLINVPLGPMPLSQLRHRASARAPAAFALQLPMSTDQASQRPGIETNCGAIHS